MAAASFTLLRRASRFSCPLDSLLLEDMTSTSSPIYSNYPFTHASTKAGDGHTSSAQSRRPVTLPPFPELYHPFEQILDSIPSNPSKLTPTETVRPSASHPFLNALKDYNNRTETWNGAAGFKSTLSPTLDAFSSLSQNTRPSELVSLLDKSWQADPDATLRIIWHLRSIHEGKAARTKFYDAFAWLYQYHPKTAVANLHNLVDPLIPYTVHQKAQSAQIAEDDMEIITHEDANETADPSVEKTVDIEAHRSHGYWKDLLNILLSATTDDLTVDSTPKSERSAKKTRRARVSSATDKADTVPVDTRSPSEIRGEKYIQAHDRLVKKLQNDLPYRALYVCVAQLFANALSRDIDILKEIADPKTSSERKTSLAFDLTLVGKWAPSPNGSHDRNTNIATAIADLLYRRGQLPISDVPLDRPLSQESAHKLRNAYSRWVTSPLRRFMHVPEVAMSAQEWHKIKYTRVPSMCMKNSKELFLKHDEDRFSQYLFDVAAGKKKISGGTLLPNELLKEAMASSKNNMKETKLQKMLTQVVDEQWRSMVARIREAGTLDNAIAICDVSGSMGSIFLSAANQPIYPAVALSLVLSEVAQPPWAHQFITFSESPELVSLDPTATLSEKASKMSHSAWSMNTDFNAVFTKLILPAAIEAKLKPEDMIRRVFVFSDMQFDDSRAASYDSYKRRSAQTKTGWETEHQIIKKAFEEAGYELPEIVYWNLAGNNAKPVTKDEPGVAMLSGFSPNMLKLFLERGEVQAPEPSETSGPSEPTERVAKERKVITPEETMLKALGHESYAHLKVID